MPLRASRVPLTGLPTLTPTLSTMIAFGGPCSAGTYQHSPGRAFTFMRPCRPSVLSLAFLSTLDKDDERQRLPNNPSGDGSAARSIVLGATNYVAECSRGSGRVKTTADLVRQQPQRPRGQDSMSSTGTRRDPRPISDLPVPASWQLLPERRGAIPASPFPSRVVPGARWTTRLDTAARRGWCPAPGRSGQMILVGRDRQGHLQLRLLNPSRSPRPSLSAIGDPDRERRMPAEWDAGGVEFSGHGPSAADAPSGSLPDVLRFLPSRRTVAARLLGPTASLPRPEAEDMARACGPAAPAGWCSISRARDVALGSRYGLPPDKERALSKDVREDGARRRDLSIERTLCRGPRSRWKKRVEVRHQHGTATASRLRRRVHPH